MKRRGFLGVLLGLVAAPVVAKVSAPALTLQAVEKAETYARTNALFRGEVGRYDGIRFIDTRQFIDAWQWREDDLAMMISRRHEPLVINRIKAA